MTQVAFLFGAGDEARTRYLHLGKVALYQMSYTRNEQDLLYQKNGNCQARIFKFCESRLRASAPISPSGMSWITCPSQVGYCAVFQLYLSLIHISLAQEAGAALAEADVCLLYETATQLRERR